PLQLGSPDHALEIWFASRMTGRDVDPYLDTLYSAFEMLESGITTVQHLHGWRIAPAARVIGVAERILKAYEDVGMRVSYSYALRDQNRLAYEADETFAQRFPAPAPGQARAGGASAHPRPRRLARRGRHRHGRRLRHHDLPQRELEPAAAERSGSAQSLGGAGSPRRHRARRGGHQRRPRHAPGD